MTKNENENMNDNENDVIKKDEPLRKVLFEGAVGGCKNSCVYGK